MNIFILDLDPVIAAQMQCDKHVVKMLLESAQMLSTAHRIIDGNGVRGLSKSGKRSVLKWSHPTLDEVLYSAVHQNHPCTQWTMISKSNYQWHYAHFVALCDEYSYRYGKVHKTDGKLRDVLKFNPKNIPDLDLTEFPLAMGDNPECKIIEDPVKSYRKFYQTKQKRFKMLWTRRKVPSWFEVIEYA